METTCFIEKWGCQSIQNFVATDSMLNNSIGSQLIISPSWTLHAVLIHKLLKLKYLYWETAKQVIRLHSIKGVKPCFQFRLLKHVYFIQQNIISNAVYYFTQFHKLYSFRFLWRNSPQWTMPSSLSRLHDHTQTHTTIGRTPLDEWSARRRDFYLTTTQHSQERDIHAPGGIRTRNPSKRALQTHALDCAATGIGTQIIQSYTFAFF
jgi:hypothetical protein